MLTTSPARVARHTSSRIVRTSSRALCPSREIWPDVGLTHQSPMRSNDAVGRSMEGRVPVIAHDIDGDRGLARWLCRLQCHYQTHSERFRPGSGLPSDNCVWSTLKEVCL